MAAAGGSSKSVVLGSGILAKTDSGADSDADA